MRIKIYGSSDDLIEIEGDVREEFSHFGGDPAYLHLGTSAVIKCQYTNEGLWRLEVLRIDNAEVVSFKDGNVDDDTNDELVIVGENLTPLGFWMCADGPTYADMREWIEREWDIEGPHHMPKARVKATFDAMWENQ